MSRINDLSIKHKLTLLSLISVAGMVVVWLTAFLSMNEVKIGGTLYADIETGTMVAGDFAPSDGDLTATRADVLTMLADAKDQTRLPALLEGFKDKRKKYEAINEKDLRLIPEGHLKDVMQKSYEAGRQYLDLVESDYIPLIVKGDTDGAQAEREKLHTAYAAYEEANGRLVETANAKLDSAEKTATSVAASRTFLLVVVAAVAVALVLALCVLIAGGILKPLNATVEMLRAVSQGNLTRRLEVTGKDEIAQMGNTLNDTIDNLSRIVTQIDTDSQVLSRASEELQSNSKELGTNSQQTTSQAAAVSSAAEEVSQNVQTVSTATEEMSASIKEISKSASEAAEVASSAARLAGSTTATMTKLSESSAEIGNVVKVITSIAEQTNLLALNATIEAARAGEAGKGFAVVANEVKELAKETAKATEDIGNKVDAIQQDAKGAVQAIEEITTVIGRINDIQNTIASAVEEQTGTTNEISRNIAETAKGSSDIAGNITGVASAAQETQKSAGVSLKAADELSKLAVRLGTVVSQFKVSSNGQPAGRSGAAYSA